MYPKIDFGKTKKAIFCVVFAFLKGGTTVFTGSMDRIKEYLEQKGHVCHALVISYHPKTKMKQWRVFGSKFSIVRTKSAKQRRRYSVEGNRNVFALVLNNGGKLFHTYSCMGQWRRMPQVYLNQFEEELIMKKNW